MPPTPQVRRPLCPRLCLTLAPFAVVFLRRFSSHQTRFHVPSPCRTSNVLAHRSTSSVRDNVPRAVPGGSDRLSGRVSDGGRCVDAVPVPGASLRLPQRRAMLAAMLLLHPRAKAGLGPGARSHSSRTVAGCCGGKSRAAWARARACRSRACPSQALCARSQRAAQTRRATLRLNRVPLDHHACDHGLHEQRPLPRHCGEPTGRRRLRTLQQFIRSEAVFVRRHDGSTQVPGPGHLLV